MKVNIDYWKCILENPTPSYKLLFEQETKYLHEHISPHSYVLDIGCGEGRTIKSILDITKNIVGIDSEQKAVNDAKNNLKDYSQIDIQLGSAFDLPFKNDTFDFVILMMTLVNFAENKVKALQEMKRVLKNNGKIIISVYSEKAITERLKMYKDIDIPILDNKDGYIIFGENVGIHVSEQFSYLELEKLASSAGLKITNHEEVKNLVYICTLEPV